MELLQASFWSHAFPRLLLFGILFIGPILWRWWKHRQQVRRHEFHFELLQIYRRKHEVLGWEFWPLGWANEIGGQTNEVVAEAGALNHALTNVHYEQRLPAESLHQPATEVYLVSFNPDTEFISSSNVVQLAVSGVLAIGRRVPLRKVVPGNEGHGFWAQLLLFSRQLAAKDVQDLSALAPEQAIVGFAVPCILQPALPSVPPAEA